MKTDTLDLTWVEFSEKKDQCCTTQITECSKQAIWVAKFHSSCGHFTHTQYYCDIHMGTQLELEKLYASKGGRTCENIWAAIGPIGVSGCQGKMWLIHYERLKNS